MAFQPFVLVESGIEVDLETKELRFTLGPVGSSDPLTFVTACLKLDNLPKFERPDKEKDEKEEKPEGEEEVDRVEPEPVPGEGGDIPVEAEVVTTEEVETNPVKPDKVKEAK